MASSGAASTEDEQAARKLAQPNERTTTPPSDSAGPALRRRASDKGAPPARRPAAKLPQAPAASAAAPGGTEPRQEAVSSSAGGSTEPSASKRRRQNPSEGEGDAGDKVDIICRMYGMGIRTTGIAQALALDEEQVVSVLTKYAGRIVGGGGGRGQEGGASGASAGSAGGDDAADSEPAADTEAAQSYLVSRLLTDPEELCCPITRVLMEDPVVAEDGNTYERRAIEEALSKKEVSPLTGQTMGKQLLPTQAIRAQVADHRACTVKEILAVVPCVGPVDAANLLRRAENFVRPRLPEREARRLLGEVLLMRSRIPGSLTGEAMAELVEVLAQVKDEAQLVELMSRKDDNNISTFLYNMDDSTISKLHKIACARCPSAPIKSSLDREWACRLAKLAAANCARAVADIQEVFSELARVLHQICSKQTGVHASMQELADCKEADAIIDLLVRLLSDAVGREDVDEGLVLRVIFDVKSRISDGVARRLRLRKEELQPLPPAVLMKVARQLARVERSQEAAVLAVMAAHKHQEAGQDDEAHTAFRFAYTMDSKNTEAGQGLMALCAAATQTSKQLQAQVQELTSQVQSQNQKIQEMEQLVQGMLTKEAYKGSLFSWDVSQVSLSSMAQGHKVESSPFKLLNSVAEGILHFYPKGCGQQSRPQVLLKCAHKAEIDFTISCDLVSRRGTRSFATNAPTKGFDFPQKDKYSTVTLYVHAITLSLKNNTVMHMRGASTAGASPAAFG